MARLLDDPPPYGTQQALSNDTLTFEVKVTVRSQGHFKGKTSRGFNPLGVIRFWPNLVAILGITPAIEMPKVATLGQRGPNGGEVKFFGVPHLCDTLSKILCIFFALLHQNMQKTIPHRAGVADFRIPDFFGKYGPPKDPSPHLRVF